VPGKAAANPPRLRRPICVLSAAVCAIVRPGHHRSRRWTRRPHLPRRGEGLRQRRHSRCSRHRGIDLTVKAPARFTGCSNALNSARRPTAPRHPALQAATAPRPKQTTSRSA